MEVGAARVRDEQLDGNARHGARQRAAGQRVRSLFRVHHLERTLQTGLQRVAFGVFMERVVEGLEAVLPCARRTGGDPERDEQDDERRPGDELHLMLRAVDFGAGAAERDRWILASYSARMRFRSMRRAFAADATLANPPADGTGSLTNATPASSAAWRSDSKVRCSAPSPRRPAAILRYSCHADAPLEFIALAWLMPAARTAGAAPVVSWIALDAAT